MQDWGDGMAHYDAEIRVKTKVDNSELIKMEADMEAAQKKADGLQDAVEKVGLDKTAAEGAEQAAADMDKLAEKAQKAATAAERFNDNLDKMRIHMADGTVYDGNLNVIKEAVKDTAELAREQERLGNISRRSAESMQKLGEETRAVNEAVRGTNQAVEGYDPVKAMTPVQNMLVFIKKSFQDIPMMFGGIADSFTAEGRQMEAEWDNLSNRAAAYKQSLKELEAEDKGFGNAEYDDAYIQWREAEQAVKEYKAQLIGTKVSQADLRSSMSRIGRSVSGIFLKMKASALSFFSSARKETKTTSGLFDKFVSRVKRIALTVFVFSAFRKAFTAMISGAKAGFENFMNYSSGFADRIQDMKNAMSTLGNQFAAAFAPIAQVVIPWLTSLVNAISTAVSYVSQFIAILGGKSTWTRATQVQDSYNKSLNNTSSAAKKAFGALAKFDDLDVLQKKEDEGGVGAGEAVGDMFEEVPVSDKFKNLADWFKDMWENSDFYDLGNLLGEKLKEALENIPWDGIKESARKIGKSIASFINGFIEVEDLGYMIGYTLAQAFNTGFEFLNAFVHELHWDSLGKFVAETLNGIFETIDWELIRDTFITGAKGIADAINAFTDWFNWDNISNTISNALNTLTETLLTFFDTVDWSALGHNIGSQITQTIEKIEWTQAGEAFSAAAESIFDLLLGAVEEVDWGEIGTSIRDFLMAVDWQTLLQDVGSLISEVLSGLIHVAFSALGGDDDAFTEWQESNRRQRDEAKAEYDQWFDEMTNSSDGFMDRLKEKFLNPDEWDINKKAHLDEHLENASRSFSEWQQENKKTRDDSQLEYDQWFSELSQKWDNEWERLRESAGTIWESIKTTLSESWLSIKETAAIIWNGLQEWFSEYWVIFTESLMSVWEEIILFFTETWETIQILFDTFIEFLKSTFEPLWEDIWNAAGELFQTFYDLLSTLSTAIKELFTGLFKSVKLLIEGDWKGAWENAQKVFEVFKEKVSGIVDTVRGLLEEFFEWVSSMISSILEGLSSIGSKISGAFSKVGNFVGGFFSGGSVSAAADTGMSAVSYSLPEIPALASGSVIRGGNPFLAWLGDQPSGQTNVEAPLSTIEQAVENVMSRNGWGIGGGSMRIVLQMNGQDVGEALVEDLLSVMRRRGYDVDVLGVT